MPFSSAYRYKALKMHMKSGRSAAIEARGAMTPFHGRRTTLQAAVAALMPKQKYDPENVPAEQNIPAKPTSVQGRRRAREREGRGSGAANTDQSVHAQPRFSGDKLASFRQAARGAV